MADLKTNTVNAWESTLVGNHAAGATTINVTDTTGSPAVPFYVVIDPGNDAKREVVLVDGAKTATTFTLSAATSRGQDGTTDVSHDSGAVIAIVPIAAMWNDLHDRVDAGDTALTTHEGAADPHPGYLTTAEGNAAYVGKADVTTAEVDPDESTTSTAFTDLATVGPQVTLTTGTRVLLLWGANLYHLSAPVSMFLGVAVSGATTVAASDQGAAVDVSVAAGAAATVMAARVLTVTAGSNTFTLKYRTSSGTMHARWRRLIVIPL